jgi:hypothetical protein
VGDLWRFLKSQEKKLAGGAGVGGMGFYGSLELRDFVAILDAMRLTSDSRLLDVGSGLGIPLMLALQIYGVKEAVGVELDPLTHLKSKVVCQRAADEFGLPMPHLACGDAAELATLEHATHVLAVWEGWDRRQQPAVATLFNESSTAGCITVVHAKLGRGDVGAHLAKLGFVGLQPEPADARSVKCGTTTLAAFTFFKARANVSGCQALFLLMLAQAQPNPNASLQGQHVSCTARGRHLAHLPPFTFSCLPPHFAGGQGHAAGRDRRRGRGHDAHGQHIGQHRRRQQEKAAGGAGHRVGGRGWEHKVESVGQGTGWVAGAGGPVRGSSCKPATDHTA